MIGRKKMTRLYELLFCALYEIEQELVQVRENAMFVCGWVAGRLPVSVTDDVENEVANRRRGELVDLGIPAELEAWECGELYGLLRMIYDDRFAGGEVSDSATFVEDWALAASDARQAVESLIDGDDAGEVKKEKDDSDGEEWKQ